MNSSTMPALALLALTEMAKGVSLRRVKAGWFLSPLDRALTIKVSPAAAQWIIGCGYAQAIRRSPTRAEYAITEAGRARLEWEEGAQP